MRLSVRFRRLCWSDTSGSSAVEFALVLPAFLMLIVGGFYLALAGFAVSNMRNAAQAAARCASVNTTVCTNSTTTTAYATNQLIGTARTRATFTSTTASCGHQVNGTMSYALNIGITTFTIPLSAQACFP
jgi:Flp pilus assembly protein TadG